MNKLPSPNIILTKSYKVFCNNTELTEADFKIPMIKIILKKISSFKILIIPLDSTKVFHI